MCLSESLNNSAKLLESKGRQRMLINPVSFILSHKFKPCQHLLLVIVNSFTLTRILTIKTEDYKLQYVSLTVQFTMQLSCFSPLTKTSESIIEIRGQGCDGFTFRVENSSKVHFLKE